MKLKVTSYMPPPHSYHMCEDEEGVEHRVDLLIGAKKGLKPEDLVNTTVEVSQLDVYLELAQDVKILVES